jgi:hypothetical protein
MQVEDAETEPRNDLPEKLREANVKVELEDLDEASEAGYLEAAQKLAEPGALEHRILL